MRKNVKVVLNAYTTQYLNQGSEGATFKVTRAIERHEWLMKNVPLPSLDLTDSEIDLLKSILSGIKLAPPDVIRDTILEHVSLLNNSDILKKISSLSTLQICKLAHVVETAGVAYA